MSLKEGAITGVLWSTAGRFFILAFEFVIGIVLARLLTPDDFGLVGMITLFFVLSETLINSGFSQALIRKLHCSEEDYATAFFFNLTVSVVLFILLFFLAPFISIFFEKTELTNIIQVLGIGLCINAFSFVQRTRMTRDIDFKMLSKISVYSSVGSGIISLVMAMTGFGVWSLVGKTLSRDAIGCFFLWIKSKWKPIFKFYKDSFKELFGFGSKLVLSGLIGIFTNNIVYIVIGKYFNVADVGFYNRAELFKNLPSQNIENIITSVGYPVLAKMQNDKVEFRKTFKRILLITSFVIGILMSGLFGISKSMIILLLGNDWLTSAEYLMYLCPVGFLYPLWSINLNVFNIVGRADLYLKMQLVMQMLTLVSVFSAIFFSIKWMIILLSVTSLIGYVFYAIYAYSYSGYHLKDQINDLLPGLYLASTMGIMVYGIGYFSGFSSIVTFIIQILFGFIYVIIISEIFRISEYMFMKEIFVNKILKRV